jgi:hypothetical protein
MFSVTATRARDAIMLKGRAGSKTKAIVNALRFPGKAAHEEAGIGHSECFTG